MNSAARKENLLTLQQLLGMSASKSEKLVGSSVLLTVEGDHPRLEEFLKAIMIRTFDHVDTAPVLGRGYDCQVKTQSTTSVSSSKIIHLGTTAKDETVIALNSIGRDLTERQHSFFYFLAACYASAIVLKSIHPDLPVTSFEEITFDPKTIVTNREILTKKIEVGTSYLAGAGAVGNAFLYALSTFDPSGEIRITDPDHASDRNMNRCILFEYNDIDYPKAEVLKVKAEKLFKNLRLVPFVSELSQVPYNNGKNWLNKLIVGVDSRRARRNLQREIPKEVFDGSTTGISEVVVHYNHVHTTGACMGCIYIKEKVEEAHEKHIAESLGVTLQDVKELFISAAVADKIVLQYPSLQGSNILGIPYDTLFKQLCGEGNLMTKNNKQVIAPLAFVSALAGAFLALNFIERHIQPQNYNYWRLSPWASPILRLKNNLPSNPECELCGSEAFQNVSKKLWPEQA